jgi:hypothetical protein
MLNDIGGVAAPQEILKVMHTKPASREYRRFAAALGGLHPRAFFGA